MRSARDWPRRLRLLALLGTCLALPPWGVVAHAGDALGERIVRGRVYNIDRGEGVPVASAVVSFRNLDASGPDASGLAVTDANGNFAFALALSSTDLVRLRASAPGFAPYTTSARADTLVGRTPAIEMGIGEAQPDRYRIRGHVSDGSRCQVDGGDAPVRLRRTGRTTRTSSTGNLYFGGVEDGDYALIIGRESLEVPVVIDGYDAEVQVCLTCPGLPSLDPPAGRQGATVFVSGDPCGALAPGRLATIYFDDVVVARTEAGQQGNFRVGISVPRAAAPGPHRVRVFGEDVAEIASATFVVDAVCRGDCDYDGEVAISELLRGVALALGNEVAACAAYGDPVSIDQLVGAVDNALSGCDEP